MFDLHWKTLTTPRTIIPRQELLTQPDVSVIGQAIEQKVKELFNGSLSIREVDAGSTNAEEEELKALTNAYYDLERFGVGFVASPRHADMLMVTGPVARNMAQALRLTYEATPEPKLVVAVGDGAIDGGVFKGSPAIIGGVHKVIPVHFQIPGDPPSPKVILCSLLHILEAVSL